MHEVDVKKVLPELIIGASSSVRMVCLTGYDFARGYSVAWAAGTGDARLDLRCIISAPQLWVKMPPEASGVHSDEMEHDIVADLRQKGWQVLVRRSLPTFNFVLVDGQEAVIGDPRSGDKRYFRVSGADQLDVLAQHFDRMWQGRGSLELLYQDVLPMSLPQQDQRLVLASQDRWQGLLARFRMHPEEMQSLRPREFEEFVADLLHRDGMDVQLTKQTRDGGADILARAQTLAGEHLFLVECKLRAAGNKVGVKMVRELFGVVEGRRAPGGILVTTSEFTKPALDFRSLHQHRLELRDLESLVQWLRRLGPPPN